MQTQFLPDSVGDAKSSTTIVSFATISTVRKGFDVAARNSDVSQRSIVESPKLVNRQAPASPPADSRLKSGKKRRDRRAATRRNSSRPFRSLNVFGLNTSSCAGLSLMR